MSLSLQHCILSSDRLALGKLVIAAVVVPAIIADCIPGTPVPSFDKQPFFIENRSAADEEGEFAVSILPTLSYIPASVAGVRVNVSSALAALKPSLIAFLKVGGKVICIFNPMPLGKIESLPFQTSRVHMAQAPSFHNA